MERQKKNLIIGVLAIVVLAGAYGVAVSSAKNKEENKTEDSKVLISNPSLKAKELIIKIGEEETSFIKEGTNWVVAEKKETELVQIAVDSLIAHIKNLNYESIVSEDSLELSQYGLLGSEITIIGDDETKISINVGDMTPDKKGCYVLMPDDKKVYLVGEETAAAIKKSPSDLRNRLPQYVNYDNSKVIKLEKDDGSVFVIEPNPKEAVAEGYGEYIITGAYSKPMAVLTEKLRDLIGVSLYNIYAVDFIDSPEELGVYGLDKPRLIISAEDNDGNTNIISVGKKAENGTTYASFSQKPYICTINSDNIDSIINAKAFDIIGKYFLTETAMEIKEVSITAKDINAVFMLSHEDGKVSCNGKDVSAADFSEVFKQISVLTADGEVSKSYKEEMLNEREEKASIIIVKDSDDVITLRFFEYDDNYYAVEYKGDVEFIAGKKAVDLVLYAVNCVK